MKSKPEWVVIDEVQKAPKLLDVVHSEIEKRKIKFALTGSSARKLKKGGANLLAGRAFVNYLYPLTFVELETEFRLIDALSWGTLPFVVNSSDDIERKFIFSLTSCLKATRGLQFEIIRTVNWGQGTVTAQRGETCFASATGGGYPVIRS